MVVSPEKMIRIKKNVPMNIATKNRNIDKILDIIVIHNSFLLLGHELPDEDCVSSIISFALLLRKFNGIVDVYLDNKIQEQVDFLDDIAKYNSIKIHIGDMKQIPKPDVIFVLDTPKPDMVAAKGYAKELLESNSVPIIEIDHHFDADAMSTGLPEYSLFLRASSTCEIIAQICYKMEQKDGFLKRHNIKELYSRNIVLSILTGMVGDAKLGNYLLKSRDKKIFNYFINKFNILLKNLNSNKNNISSVYEILSMLDRLSLSEHEILKKILRNAEYFEDIGIVIIDEKKSKQLFLSNEFASVVHVFKTATNALAENSGKVGVSAYFDPPESSDKIQFRVRASQSANNLNLLSILLDLQISDGGGHPGAIGFRISKDDCKDLKQFVELLLEKIRVVIYRAK